MKEIITKYNVIWIDDEFDKMSQLAYFAKTTWNIAYIVIISGYEANVDKLQFIFMY